MLFGSGDHTNLPAGQHTRVILTRETQSGDKTEGRGRRDGTLIQRWPYHAIDQVVHIQVSARRITEDRALVGGGLSAGDEAPQSFGQQLNGWNRTKPNKSATKRNSSADIGKRRLGIPSRVPKV